MALNPASDAFYDRVVDIRAKFKMVRSASLDDAKLNPPPAGQARQHPRWQPLPANMMSSAGWKRKATSNPYTRRKPPAVDPWCAARGEKGWTSLRLPLKYRNALLTHPD